MFIEDIENNCKDPNHLPPTMMVFSKSGTWVCPSCGHATKIVVPTC